MLFLKLGFRNLQRNRRRTFLTMSAMIVANMLLIFALSMNDGMIWDIINNATEIIHGHLSISANGYPDQPTINLTIPEKTEFRQDLLKRPGIKGVCGRISCFALLSCGNDDACRTLPSEILGIDPVEERAVSRLEKSIIGGNFLPRSDSREVLLGNGLARNLGAKVGGEVVLMGQAADGSTAAEVFLVAGIFDTGSSLRDATLAIFGRKTVQEVFCLENRIHKWNVFLIDPLSAEKTAGELKGGHENMEFTPWQKILPQFAQVYKLLGIIQYISMVIFYSAVFLVSSNTMYMAFLERTREFAIVRAIGLSPSRLSGLLLIEGLILSGLSGVLGTILGVLVSHYFMHWPFDLGMFFPTLSYGGSSIHPRIICQPSVSTVLMPFFTMVFLGPLIAFFPIVGLWGLHPAEALRDS